MKNLSIIVLLCIIVLAIGYFSYKKNPSHSGMETKHESQTGGQVTGCGSVTSKKTGTGTCEKYPDSYYIYKNILENSEAQKDWEDFTMLVTRECLSKEPYEQHACALLKKGDIASIETDSQLLDFDKKLLKTVITGVDHCNGDTNCIFAVQMVKSLETMNSDFNLPKIDTSRAVEWYMYKKKFPKEYDQKLDALFLKDCHS